MMVAIVLALCLVADPTECKKVRPPVEVSFMECAMKGPEIAAEYVTEHPKWAVRGWQCEIGERGKQA